MTMFLRYFSLALVIILIFSFGFIVYASVSYREPEYIDEEKAIKIAKEYISKSNSKEYVELILDYDLPKVEMEYVDKKVLHLSGKGKNVVNSKTCWRVTFDTQQDSIFGPHKVYINGVSGEVYGSPYRYWVKLDN